MKVLCRNAKAMGIPIVEGHTYTVKRDFIGPQVATDSPIEGMETVPGYELVEVGGYFRADRFEVVS